MVELVDGLIIALSSAGLTAVLTHYFTKRRSQSEAVDWHLDRFPERGKDHVGVWNTGKKVIDACQVFCDDVECVWWDSLKPGPRAIHLGGGANAVLPESHESNPLIEVRSRNQKPRRIRYFDITLRSGY